MAVKRYNGSSWDTVAGLGAQGAAATSSSITTWVKTASGGETSLSGNSDSSTTLAYTPGQEQVFINGVLQVRGSDYTATNGTSITGLTALIAGDVATVTSVNAFSVTGAVPLSTVTANGDLIVGTSSGAVGRLGIGSNGNLLTVAGGVPTWASPGAAVTSYTLLNSGGTALTGASTITVSGLSGYNYLYASVQGASSASSAADFNFRLNADSTANYFATGFWLGWGASNSVTGNGALQNGTTTFYAGRSNGAAGTANSSLYISGANSTGIKPTISLGTGTSTGGELWSSFGHYAGTSVISSISITSNGGNFDAGTLFIYGGN